MDLQVKIKSFYPENIDSMPGFALLAAKGDKVILKTAAGLADVEAGRAIDPDDNFIIASNTKQFTCFAILLLCNEGLLDLDESVSRFFPDFPEYVKGITVRNLMTHTSGVKEYFSDADENNIPKFRGYLAADMLEFVKGYTEPDFAPNTKWSYSNSAYVMLGEIIRQLGGMPYGQFIEKRILRPLGMNNSFSPDDADHRDARLTEGYRETEDGFTKVPYDMFGIGYADGNISSNVEDMLKWKRYLHSDSDFLLPAKIRHTMFVSQILEDGTDTQYGFGIFDGGMAERERLDFGERKVLWHTGGTEGFISYAGYFPDDDLTLIWLSNYASKDGMNIIKPVAETLFEEEN